MNRLAVAAFFALLLPACAIDAPAPQNIRCSRHEECALYGGKCVAAPEGTGRVCCQGPQCLGDLPDGGDAAVVADTPPRSLDAAEVDAPRAAPDGSPDLPRGMGGVQIVDTVPPSPSFANTPRVRGRAPAGVTVGLYLGEKCEGTPVVAGSASATGDFDIAVPVPRNVSSTLRAGVLFETGLYCSSGLAYLHDDVPPTVIRVQPAAGATDVLRTDPVAVYLSEPPGPETGGPITFTLRERQRPLRGRTELSGKVLTFIPDARLAAQVPHSISIEGVTDAAGNRLAGPTTSSFTTGALGWTPVQSLPGPDAGLETSELFLTVNPRGSGGVFWSGSSQGGPQQLWWSRLRPAGWEPGEALQMNATSNAVGARAVTDEAGNVTLAWMQTPVNDPSPSDGLWVRRLPDQGPAGPARRLGDAMYLSGMGAGPTLALIAAAIDCKPVLYAARAAGGWTWGREAWPDTPPDEECGQLRLASNAAGTFVALTATSRGEPTAKDVLRARSLEPGGAWSAPVTLQEGQGKIAFLGPILFTSDGQALVVWSRRLAPADPAGGVTVMTARFLPGTGWGQPAEAFRVADGSPFFEVAAAPSGKVVMVWSTLRQRARSVQATVFSPGAGWSPVETLTLATTDGPAHAAQVVMDARGAATALWHADTAPARRAAFLGRHGGDGTWSAPYLIDGSLGLVAPISRMAVDGAGQVTVVFLPLGGGSPRWLRLE